MKQNKRTENNQQKTKGKQQKQQKATNYLDYLYLAWYS